MSRPPQAPCRNNRQVERNRSDPPAPGALCSKKGPRGPRACAFDRSAGLSGLFSLPLTSLQGCGDQEAGCLVPKQGHRGLDACPAAPAPAIAAGGMYLP